MLLQNVSLLENLYHNGFDLDFYDNNRTKGHSRFKMATESANEYVDGLHLADIDIPFRFLILVALDCTDCAVAIPAYNALFSKMTKWRYSIINKSEIKEDFARFLKVGSKQTVPQILILNENYDYVTRWFDKSLNLRYHYDRISSLGLDNDAKRQRIFDTPEMHPRYEVKRIIDELVILLRKSKFYL